MRKLLFLLITTALILPAAAQTKLTKPEKRDVFITTFCKSIQATVLVKKEMVEKTGEGTWWFKKFNTSPRCDLSCIVPKLQNLDCEKCGVMIWLQHWEQDDYRYYCTLLVDATEPITVMFNSMDNTITIFYLTR